VFGYEYDAKLTAEERLKIIDSIVKEYIKKQKVRYICY
jgi:hypothetical protein